MISDNIVHFAQYELQLIALSWLAVWYAIKVYRLARLPMTWENGSPKGNAALGILNCYAALLMPWSMESSKKHLWRWVEFAAYHVGALVAILNTFTTPFMHGLMTQTVRLTFAILIAPAVILGLVKLVRRILRPEMRLISTPEDYFALASVEVFLFLAVMALLLNSPLWRIMYFFVTAAFLFYLPFSKISHYIYLAFAGVVTGSRYGWRGVRPQVRSSK